MRYISPHIIIIIIIISLPTNALETGLSSKLYSKSSSLSGTSKHLLAGISSVILAAHETNRPVKSPRFSGFPLFSFPLPIFF